MLSYLYRDLGYTGNRRDYYDPRNSFLNDVMARRIGIPITLGVLTIEVGRRVGAPLAGVGMPGHFLLRDRVDQTVFVDVFAGGEVIDRAGCERTFRRLHGDGVDFDPEFLAPVGPLVIVSRMLANLKQIYARDGDNQNLAWVMQLRACWPGTPSTERRELASLLAGLGRFAEAADALEALADNADATSAERYAAVAARVRARLN